MYLGPAWAWFLVVAGAVAAGTYEVGSMTHPDDRVSKLVLVATSLAVTSTLYVYSDSPRELLTLLFGYPVIALLVPLFRLKDLASAGLRIMSGIAAPLYVGGLGATLALLRRDFPGLEGPGFVLMTLTIAWWSDVGGYFGGRYFGRTKLYERVSPKKTREGFVGGLGGAVIAALLAHFWYLPQPSVWHAVSLALVASVLGQFGDLAESLLKRSTGVKDSGALIPGHGGMLDRIDAVLVVSPVVFLYALWFYVPA